MKAVYRLEDLREGLPINEAGQELALAVVGNPVQHSKSPQLHQAALEEAGVAGFYGRLQLEQGELAEAFSLGRSLGMLGMNVTVPHKHEAMAACDRLDESAEFLGAVNTVCFTSEGLVGYNTDGGGLSLAVAEAFGKSLNEFEVTIIGAGGGAGAAVAAQCAIEGVKKLHLVNRSSEKLAILQQHLSVLPVAEAADVDISNHSLTDADLPEVLASSSLIINATSLGLKAEDALPCELADINLNQCFYDMVYQPDLTPWLQQAKSQEAKIADGLTMLLHQGQLAFKLFTKKQPNVNLMRDSLYAK